MSGRTTQLARQLRKLRSEEDPKTLRRATQLALELACEHAEVEDSAQALTLLAERGVVDKAVVERIAAGQVEARDLDRLLRGIEHGAVVPDAPFEPIVRWESVGGAVTQAAVNVSGRILVVEVRDGKATIRLDDKPLPLEAGKAAASFPLKSAPMGRAEMVHEPTGSVLVTWQELTLRLAPDFASVAIL